MKYYLQPLGCLTAAFLIWAVGSCNKSQTTSSPATVVHSDPEVQQKLDKAVNASLEQFEGKPLAFIQNLRPVIDACLPNLDTLHDVVLANAWHKIGIRYNQTNNPVNALDAFIHALHIREKMLGPSHDLTLKMHKNMGVIYKDMLNEPEKSRDCLLRARNSLIKETDSQLRFEIFLNLGNVCNFLGEFADASGYFDVALAIASLEKDSSARQENLASVYNDYATLHHNLLAYEQAEEKASEALRICGNSLDDTRAKCLNTLGLAYKNRGRLPESVACFQKAIELNKNLGDSVEEAKAWNNLGICYRLMHDYKSSEKALNQSIEINNRVALKKIPLAGNYNNLAEIKMDHGSYPQALALLNEALWMLSTPPAETASPVIPPIQNLSGDLPRCMDILRNRARCEVAQAVANPDQYEDAIGTYDSLVLLMGRIRQQYLEEFSKVHFAADADSILSEAVSTCNRFLSQNPGLLTAKAFQYADYSKANTLLEQVRLVGSQRLGNIPPQIWNELRDLRQELNKLDEKIETINATGTSAESSELLQKRLRINTSIKEKSREIERYNAGLFSGITVTQVQHDLLDPDQALIEYKFAGKQLYAFVVTPNFVKMVPLLTGSPAAFDSLNAHVEALRNGIIDGPNNAAAHQSYCHSAFGLYKLLITPLESLLQQNRLLIVPEGLLDRIPFEALVSKPVDPVQEPEAFLAGRFSIGYGYSAGLLLEMKKNQTRTGLSHRVAAFAPAIHADLKPGMAGLSLQITRFLPFKPLMWNEREIATMGDLVATDHYTGSQANKAAFFENSARHACVHVSTHAYLNDLFPSASFLVFSQEQDTVQPEQLLALRELNNFDPLNIELMVFTACQTALGKNLRGEGAMSMSRGLASAGVKSFVTTLWEVNQEKTAALAPLFYAQLAQGTHTTKDQALSRAKKEFMTKSTLNRYPAYWAGLVLSGDMKPVTLEKPGDYQTISVLIGAGIIALIGWLLRKRNRTASTRSQQA